MILPNYIRTTISPYKIPINQSVYIMECQPRVLLPLLKYLLHHTATGIVTTTPQDLHLVEPGAGPEDAVECLDALFIFF